MTDALRVTVDGWVAVATNEPIADVDGCMWSIADIDGWFGGLGVRSLGAERTRGDGAFDGPVFLAGRRVTMTGQLLTRSPETLQVGMDRIAAVLAGGDRSGTLIVDETSRGLSRQAYCRLDSQGRAKRTSALTADWQLTVYCPDPLRYGQAVSTSTGLPTSGGGLTYPLTYPLTYGAAGNPGQIILDNTTGTADAPVLFSVTGSLPSGFEISAAGQRLRYAAAVPSGQTVTIDTSSGQVLVEGTADRRSNLTVADWIQVPARSALTVQFTSLGGTYDAGAILTATFRAASL